MNSWTVEVLEWISNDKLCNCKPMNTLNRAAEHHTMLTIDLTSFVKQHTLCNAKCSSTPCDFTHPNDITTAFGLCVSICKIGGAIENGLNAFLMHFYCDTLFQYTLRQDGRRQRGLNCADLAHLGCFKYTLTPNAGDHFINSLALGRFEWSAIVIRRTLHMCWHTIIQCLMRFITWILTWK